MLQSASASMGGFYADSQSEVVKDLGFMPVPVHSVEKCFFFQLGTVKIK
jgi:hypothetical protein